MIRVATEILKVVSDHSQLAYCLVCAKTDEILYCNKMFCSLWNLEHLEEELYNGRLKYSHIITGMASLVADESLGFFMNLDDGVVAELSLRSGRTLRRVIKQIYDEEDVSIGMLYIYEDITTERVQENLVYKTNNDLHLLQRYKLFFEKSRDIIMLMDCTGQIVEVNAAAERAYGYTREELLGMKIADLRDERQMVFCQNQIETAITKGILFQTVHKRRDRSTFHVEVSSQSVNIQGTKYLLSVIRNIDEQKRLEHYVHHAIRHDYRTDIPNRYFMEELLSNSEYSNFACNALLLIDIDNLKTINESFGSTIGYQLIIEVASLLRSMLRKRDFLARVGGDEFAIFLPGTNVRDAQRIAHKILKTIEKEKFNAYEGPSPIRLTASVGIAAIDNWNERDKLLSYASIALSAAKEDVTNRIAIFDKNDRRCAACGDQQILALLRSAIEENRVKLYFQPVTQTDNKIRHYEALLRLFDHEGKTISPAVFIPIAERYGIIPSFDRWVVKSALELLEKYKDLTIFINVSGVTLGDRRTRDWIEKTIIAQPVEACRLGFEITETAAIKNIMETELWIRRLKSRGCLFALDDFGVGFSSFSHLQILPVDYVKIDGSFIRNVDIDPTNRSLVHAINVVAHTLGKQTIAEFVENKSIWKTLKELKVDCGQGYLWGRPCPIDELFISKSIAG